MFDSWKQTNYPKLLNSCRLKKKLKVESQCEVLMLARALSSTCVLFRRLPSCWDGASGVRQTESALSAPAEHQRQSNLIHGARLLCALLKSEAWVIHVRRRLNISNGSIVVQLLDSWAITSSSIRPVMDTFKPRLTCWVFTAEQRIWAADLPQNHLKTSGTATDRRHYSSFLLPNNSQRN